MLVPLWPEGDLKGESQQRNVEADIKCRQSREPAEQRRSVS